MFVETKYTLHFLFFNCIKKGNCKYKLYANAELVKERNYINTNNDKTEHCTMITFCSY